MNKAFQQELRWMQLALQASQHRPRQRAGLISLLDRWTDGQIMALGNAHRPGWRFQTRAAALHAIKGKPSHSPQLVESLESGLFLSNFK